MKIASNLGALLLGTLSFVLTLGMVLGLQKVAGINLFAIMWWGVIPLGALITGLLAASGYYAGAVRFNVRPTRFVACAMLLVAGALQVAFYYVQYAMATTEDGQHISDIVGFPRFAGWMLSHAKYSLVVHGYQPGGPGGGLEVGIFGYAIGALQFVALVVGGFALYAVLAEKPYCDSCARYLTKVLTVHLPFGGDMSTLTELRKAEGLSGHYVEQLQELPAGAGSALELELGQCPGCAREVLVERPMFTKGGKLAYQGDAYRTLWATASQSIASDLAKLRPHPSERSAPTAKLD